MPLIPLIAGFFFPRLVVILLYLFTNWWSDSFSGVLLPILGFLFMPITLLWYGVSEAFTTDSVQTAGLIVAVLLDLGIIGGGVKGR